MANRDEALKAAVEFDAELREENGLALVSLAGELDLSNAPALRELLVSLEVVAARGVRISLREVTFLDSSVIGVIVAACKRTRSAGGTFSVLCGPGDGKTNTGDRRAAGLPQHRSWLVARATDLANGPGHKAR